MSKRWILGLILVAGIATIAGGIWGLGMVRENVPVSAEATPTATRPETTLSNPVKFFPVQKTEFEGQAYPADLISGTLVLENGAVIHVGGVIFVPSMSRDLICTKFAQPPFLHTICTRFSSRRFP